MTRRDIPSNHHPPQGTARRSLSAPSTLLLTAGQAREAPRGCRSDRSGGPATAGRDTRVEYWLSGRLGSQRPWPEEVVGVGLDLLVRFAHQAQEPAGARLVLGEVRV